MIMLWLLLLGIIMGAAAQHCIKRAPLVFEMNMSGLTRRCQCDTGNPPTPTYCSKLEKTAGQHWDPPYCSERFVDVGDVCTIFCGDDYELSGSEMIECTTNGWNGSGGLGNIPRCLLAPDLGDQIIKDINNTLSSGIPSGFLFIMDESGSIEPEDFDVEKNFVMALVNAFPLSSNRSAGAISFSTNTQVRVKLSNTDHCTFLSTIKPIISEKQWTNMDEALKLAYQEIQANRIHKLTLIIFITDGKYTSENPEASANALKNNDTILFTIGVGGYERSEVEPMASIGKNGAPLFYGITDFTVFKTIADYLQTTYGGAAPQCWHQFIP